MIIKKQFLFIATFQVHGLFWIPRASWRKCPFSNFSTSHVSINKRWDISFFLFAPTPPPTPPCYIREFKKWWWWLCRHCQLKMNLSLAYKFCDTLKSFRLFLTIKTILILNMEHSIKLGIEILYINHRHSCSWDNAKFGHFTSLFCKDHKEIYNA